MEKERFLPMVEMTKLLMDCWWINEWIPASAGMTEIM
jgi:hypothetical protein